MSTEQVTTEETPDKTAGEPDSDQDAVSSSHADVLPSEDAGLKLIEALTLANALLRTTAAAPPPQFQPAPKPEKSIEEETNPEPKQKLTLETQDMIAMPVARCEALVDDMSGEVTKFLPYDHENSQWRILRLAMDLAQLLCLTGVFTGLMASNVLKGSRVWNLGGWRLCLMMYMVLSGWILAKWVVDLLGVFVDHVVIRLLRANKQKNTTAAANNRKTHRQRRRSYEAEPEPEPEPRLLQIDRKEIEALRDLEADKVKEHLENMARVVHGMRGTARVFVWIASLLAAWILLFRCKAEATRLPRHVNEEMGKVTRALVATLVGTLLWGLKTLFVQLLAWSFIVKKSETEIEASCKEQAQLVDIWDAVDPDHHQHLLPKQLQDGARSDSKKLVRFRTWVLSTLMDSLLGEDREESSSSGPGRKVLNQEYDVIKKVRRHWTPKYLIPKITKRELPVFVMAEKSHHARRISLERMARATADHLFLKMVKMCHPSVSDAQLPKVRYIKEASMPKELFEKLEKVIPLVPLNLDGDTRRFRRSDFRKWMIKVYRHRLVLIRAITGRDNVIGDFNRTLSCVAALVISFVWLLVTGSLTVELMISIATFLGTLKFIFDDTAKTAFEATMFVFATRPFDVGNLCMVDENEMIVHDMNLLSTRFKQADGQMVYYPNSALIKKTLVNCRLSDQNNIGSSVEFKVDASVLAYEPIRKLMDEIQEYMKKKSEIWNIEKCKMKVKKMDYLLTLNLRHKANFYNGGDKKTQINELVEKIKKTIKKISQTT